MTHFKTKSIAQIILAIALIFQAIMNLVWMPLVKEYIGKGNNLLYEIYGTGYILFWCVWIIIFISYGTFLYYWGKESGLNERR